MPVPPGSEVNTDISRTYYWQTHAWSRAAIRLGCRSAWANLTHDLRDQAGALKRQGLTIDRTVSVERINMFSFEDTLTQLQGGAERSFARLGSVERHGDFKAS